MGQNIVHDTFVAKPGKTPRTHQLFSRPFLGASQTLTIEAVGLRIKAEPDVVALVGPNVSATLVVEGLNQAEFPKLAAAIPPPPAPPTPVPEPEPVDAAAAGDAATPAAPPAPAPEPEPAPAPPDDSNYVPDATDPFEGQGEVKFVAATGKLRGTQSYQVMVSFDAALWEALGERPFELVAYLVGQRQMVG